VDWWNNHKTRYQKRSNLPSGTTPNFIYDFPQNFGLKHCGVKISREDIDALRLTIPRSREECFQWVSTEFDMAASAAYVQCGSPQLDHTVGWKIFIDMVKILKA